MDADRYISILEALLPFLKDVYPDGHRFVQDNDIYKAYLKACPWLFLAEWGELVQTPQECPDLNDFNPIENLWHEMKEFLRREVKPQNKAELVAGIEEFWGSVTTEKCRRYVRHLRKVISCVISEDGGASGY